VNKFNLIYRGSRDGFKSSDFHKYCDDKGATLIIIKSETGEIFGGYTDISWTSYKIRSKGDELKAGKGNSFLFSLRQDFNFTQLKCKNKKSEVSHLKDWLCCFGDNDLFINNDCNMNNLSYSNLGNSFVLP
jgi:hypothetical protein